MQRITHFWLDMNTGNWEVIPTNFMKHEIILMLNHYKKNINIHNELLFKK